MTRQRKPRDPFLSPDRRTHLSQLSGQSRRNVRGRIRRLRAWQAQAAVEAYHRSQVVKADAARGANVARAAARSARITNAQHNRRLAADRAAGAKDFAAAGHILGVTEAQAKAQYVMEGVGQ
jgi:hypothetical protein